MKRLMKRQSTPRLIALGFALVILLGSALLSLPCCLKEGVTMRYIDALYTSTSAVCVTGLMTIDAGDTFSPLGQFLLAMMMQIGALGVMTVGAGVILLMGHRVNMKEQGILRESMNLDSGKGVVRFLKSVFLLTLTFQLIGAALSYIVFSKDYPPLKAISISLFHSIAAFNNSGLDILGGFRSMTPYRDSLLLNLTTCCLIFFGGLGFWVIREMIEKRLNWRRFSMHTKVTLSVSLVLIVAGTLLLRLTEHITWLGALFQSVSARTAGFSTYSMGGFSNAGRMVMIVLMFIGASSGSTGGGIKTSTFFVLLQGVKSAATNQSEKAFRYAVPANAFRKAAVITLMALSVILLGTYLLLAMEPQLCLSDALFEVVSAFGTAGLSTGITTTLSVGSKLLSILIMYIGRLGPMTIATLWYFSKGERVSFPDGNIAIG